MLKARTQTDHRQAITWLALEIDERRRRLEQLAGHMSDETSLERTPSRLSRRATGYRTFCDFLRGIAGERVTSGALEIRGTRNSIDRAYRAVMRSDLADDIKQQLRERYFRLCNQTGLRARPSLPVHRAEHQPTR